MQLKQKNDTTPLIAASHNGHVEIVDLLIKGGADCNKSNGYGASPLYEFSRAGHVDIVDLLIKSGANCNKTKKKQNSFYDSFVDHVEIEDLLI